LIAEPNLGWDKKAGLTHRKTEIEIEMIVRPELIMTTVYFVSIRCYFRHPRLARASLDYEEVTSID